LEIEIIKAYIATQTYKEAKMMKQKKATTKIALILESKASALVCPKLKLWTPSYQTIFNYLIFNRALPALIFTLSSTASVVLPIS
jgi:hypothetical protein